MLLFFTASLLLFFSAPEGRAESGNLIVLNKSGNTASIIDLKTGRAVSTIPTGEAPHEVAVSPDGKTAVVADYGVRGKPGNTLTVIDLSSHKVVETISLGMYQRPHGIVFLSDGKRLLVTSETKKSLLLLDLQKKGADKIVKTFATDQEISHMVAITPDNRMAYTANIRSGSITAIDLKSGGPPKIIATGKGAEGIDVSTDGKQVWVTNRAEDTISVIDTVSLKVIKTIPCASFPIRLKFTPGGKEVLVSAARSGELVFINPSTYKVVHRLPFKLRAADDSTSRLFKNQFEKSPVPIGILLHPTGKWAYVAAAYADRVAVVDVAERKLVKWLATGKEPDGLGFYYQKKQNL
jgi:YVTN family beta-propeller protein